MDRIQYEVLGRGEPLVLYHGLIGSGERWSDTGHVTGLEDSCRRILINARGQGECHKPHEPAAHGGRNQPVDVATVLDDLGTASARFWDHSMGGDVALTLGRHHRDRVSVLVGHRLRPPRRRGRRGGRNGGVGG